MIDLPAHALGLGAALGIGLLIGAEREERKADESPRGAAGVRTFALAALLGGVGQIAAGTIGLALAVALVILINAAGYVALRAFGAAKGLTLAGLAGGFVSSTTTIGSMGSRAREQSGRAGSRRTRRCSRYCSHFPPTRSPRRWWPASPVALRLRCVSCRVCCSC